MNIIKDTAANSNVQDSIKKEVNWQASVDKEVGRVESSFTADPGVDSKKESEKSVAVKRQESLQRHDSNIVTSNVEMAVSQTGTAKRKKKKKEEVAISSSKHKNTIAHN